MCQALASSGTSLCPTPQSAFYTLKHKELYQTVILGSDTNWNHNLPPTASVVFSVGESFKLPLQEKNGIYVIFLLWYSEFWRGQLVPTALSAEEASRGNWKQLDLWSVCLFYFIPSFSHCLEDSPFLCRHPQNLHSWDTNFSLLYEYSVPGIAVEGSPAPPLPSSARSLDSLHSWSGEDDLCQSTMGHR